MQIKIFRQSDEKGINAFVKESDILKDGVRFLKDGYVAIFYVEPGAPHGLSQKDAANELSAELAKIQHNLIAYECERMMYFHREMKNNGSDKQRTENRAGLSAAERNIEIARLQIGQYRDLIARLLSGEFKI